MVKVGGYLEFDGGVLFFFDSRKGRGQDKLGQIWKFKIFLKKHAYLVELRPSVLSTSSIFTFENYKRQKMLFLGDSIAFTWFLLLQSQKWKYWIEILHACCLYVAL